MNAELPSTSLRPRNRRLLSHNHEVSSFTNVFANSSELKGPTMSSLSSSTSSSRAISPIPNKHLSRSTQTRLDPQGSQSQSRSFGTSDALASTSSTFITSTSLWETSWSSLQGIASSLFDGSALGTSSRDQSPRPRRRHLETIESRKAKNPPQWGPSGNVEKQLGHGSREDRLAQVQAKKRQTLLTANGYMAPDFSGRYKRRNSEDRMASSEPPMEHEDRDALVYLHNVRPNDTLAGITIKYKCELNIFRKANRLWPNDSIQIRKTVVLPVDACSIRGRKVPEPQAQPSPSKNRYSEDDMLTPTNVHHPWGDSAASSETIEVPLSSISVSPPISISNPDNTSWKHDSWVMIDGFPEAVEIARLSRRSLGFFPPNRRKSMSLDLDTPSGSLDLSRGSPYGEFHRKELRSSSSSQFAHQLQGPGGVGTLGKGVHSPGPAQDGLNKLFASHLPNVAPRTSFDSATSTSSTGIENVGSAIEGWVRKLANKAAAGVQSPAPGRRSGVGDLIELTDSLEMGDDADGSGDKGDTATVKSAVGTWKDEQDRMLREHFPPRGRVFRQSTRRD